MKHRQSLAITPTHVTYLTHEHEAETPTELTVRHAECIRRYLAPVPEHRRQGVRGFGLYAPTNTELLTLARTGHEQAPVEWPVVLTWQAYYLQLTGTPEPFTCPECGAPLVPRALLPRRVHDPTVWGAVPSGSLHA